MARIPIHLSIPTPCREDWQQMSPDGRGRFCAQCQKTVIDFSSWSDAALYEFFSKNTGPVCGRFFNTQLNREIKIPHQPKSRLYRLAIACGLTLIFAQLPEAHSRVKAPVEMLQINDSETEGDDRGTISGKIIDEKGEIVPDINVGILPLTEEPPVASLYRSDRNGNFQSSPLAPGRYKVFLYLDGYKLKDRIEIDVRATDTTYVTLRVEKTTTVPIFTTGSIAVDRGKALGEKGERIKIHELRTSDINNEIIKPAKK